MATEFPDRPIVVPVITSAVSHAAAAGHEVAHRLLLWRDRAKSLEAYAVATVSNAGRYWCVHAHTELSGDRTRSRDYLLPFLVVCHGSLRFTQKIHGNFYIALVNAFAEDNPQWTKTQQPWHDHLALYWAIASIGAGQDMAVVKAIYGFDLGQTIDWLDRAADMNNM